MRFRAGRLADDVTLTEAAYQLAGLIDESPTRAAGRQPGDELGETLEIARQRVLGFAREGLGRGLLEPRPD